MPLNNKLYNVNEKLMTYKILTDKLNHLQNFFHNVQKFLSQSSFEKMIKIL